MLTYCDVIDTRADRQQLWRHNNRLFRRGCYGCFLSTTNASNELCTCLVLNWSEVWQSSDWQRAGIIICIFTNMGQPLPIAIVTSQWPIVPTGIYGRMILRSARVEGIAITLSCLVHVWLHHFAYRDRIIHYGTLGDQTIYTRFGLICLFTLLIIFGLPCFNTGHR